MENIIALDWQQFVVWLGHTLISAWLRTKKESSLCKIKYLAVCYFLVGPPPSQFHRIHFFCSDVGEDDQFEEEKDLIIKEIEELCNLSNPTMA